MQSTYDPTASESYCALRNALSAVHGDTSAVQSLLSSLSDGGKGWLQSAYYELRIALTHGRIKDAETVGTLIGMVLDVRAEFIENL